MKKDIKILPKRRIINAIGQVAFLILFIVMLPSVSTSQESNFVSAVIQDAGGDLDKLNKIIDEHESLLKRYPKGEFAATIMFQLAELYEQKSSLVFQKEMAAYEQELVKYDNGEIDQEPVTPRITLRETMEYCYRLLREFPQIDFKDKVLYKLAMAHLQEGNQIKAKSFFEEIINKYPQSAINLESHFRLGEYYFDRRDFNNAIIHYRFLLGKWDNPYFDMALYKLGWSYYNINEYPDAISTFIYLLEDMNLVERTNSQILSKNKTDLRTEAIQYIASCFTEYGGPAAAKDFLQSRKDKDYSLPILLDIAELYQKRSYYPEAIEAYETLLELYPFYEEAPEIYQRIVENYEFDDRIDEAIKAREKIIKKFGPGGEWTTHFTEGELYSRAIKIAKENLIYLGKYYQAEAQKSDRVRDYRLAIDKYQEFLDKFPKSEEAATINYYLAECYYNSGDYANAATSYFDVVTKYDSSRFRQEAAFNRILSYYQLTGIDQSIDSVTIYIDEFLGTDEILTVSVSHQSEIDLLRACNDFVLMFPDSKWIDQVLLKYGETLHELSAYIPAVKVYKKIVEMGPDKPYHLLAAMNLAQSYFDGGHYEQAEVWFKTIIENFPDSTRYIEKAQKLAISSRFKIAEARSAEGKAEEAATILSKIADDADDPKFQVRALFEAGNQYQKAGEPTLAALAFEELAKKFPNEELADEALYKAAAIRESGEEWSLAAADYLRLVDTHPGSKFAMRALKNAAQCYETIEDWYAAQTVYKRFAETFTDSPDDVIECLFKTGEMAYKAGNFTEASDQFKMTLAKFNEYEDKGKDVDYYFVAQAQFMLGEILFEDYKKIELTPPFKPSLRKKIQKFNQVLAAYKNTLSFQVADWSTAASYKIGMAFEELVRAFIEAPPPPGLKKEEIQLYRNTLAESAKPYKKQALLAYKRNVEQAEANHIQNSWITESKKRIEILSEQLQPTNQSPTQSETTQKEGTTSS